MEAIATVGLDIAKSVFQVHGIDAAGKVIIRRQLKRRHVLPFFQRRRSLRRFRSSRRIDRTSDPDDAKYSARKATAAQPVEEVLIFVGLATMTWIQSRFEDVVEQILRHVVNARITVYRSMVRCHRS